MLQGTPQTATSTFIWEDQSLPILYYPKPKVRRVQRTVAAMQQDRINKKMEKERHKKAHRHAMLKYKADFMKTADNRECVGKSAEARLQ